MTDKFFDRSRTIARLRQGPLAAYIDPFATVLWEQGFSRGASRFQIRVVSDFSRWLEREHLGPEALGESVIDRYLRGRRRNDKLIWQRTPVLNRLHHMLSQMGVTPAAQRGSIVTPREEMIEAYQQYLRQERGLSERTIPNMLSYVKLFLSEQFPHDRFDFAALSPCDVTRFVQRYAARVRSATAKWLVAALRNFLRYLQHRGEIQTDLAACIPSVPPYSVSTVPRFLPAGAVQRILLGCDRSTSRGRRDYAVLLLLARLGLRSGEIVTLDLNDIDWDTGQIAIQGKGGRCSRLPMLADVGEALADYLRQDRPPGSSRCLFLTQRAPVAGLSAHGIRALVKRAMVRAGVDFPRKGAHVFRHTLATGMLQRGASLDEIGEVLRHRSPNTTRVYAKVDLTALRKLAPCWPGGAR